MTTIAICFKVTLANGAVMGFADHAHNLKIKDICYSASFGMSSSAIESSASMNSDTLSISCILNSDCINKNDILNGMYDGAYVEIFAINYLQPDIGDIVLKTGFINEITIKNNKFDAEIRSLAQNFSTSICRVYSPTCRAKFADASCAIDKQKYAIKAKVLKALDRFRLRIKLMDKAPELLLSIGEVRIVQDHRAFAIRSFNAADGVVTLLEAVPSCIKPNNKISIYPGCDKHLRTCSDVYGNILNFRGEPHVPGVDEVYKTATTK